jgi:dihydroorotate dehydrogenase
MYRIARTALFQLSPETSHRLALLGLALAYQFGLLRRMSALQPKRPVRVMGLEFPNPFGLAAGMDKNGDYINPLGALGFGFIEIGTVTPLPQPGNPPPRIFRLPEQQAIINRLGFNNLGIEHLVKQVEKRNYAGVLGINIGKNLATPIGEAAVDYCLCMEKVYTVADYIAVNISSPNTPGLRDLQDITKLKKLLTALKSKQSELADRHGRYVPLTVKIAPDQSDDEIKALARVLVQKEIDGVIATNTTVARPQVEKHQYASERGGLSGAPLAERATQIVDILATELDGALPIIAVGGICSGSDAAAKMSAGAKLVQIYSGFIYRGPGLIREMAEATQGI